MPHPRRHTDRSGRQGVARQHCSQGSERAASTNSQVAQGESVSGKKKVSTEEQQRRAKRNVDERRTR